jgi:hypothetical protein
MFFKLDKNLIEVKHDSTNKIKSKYQLDTYLHEISQRSYPGFPIKRPKPPKTNARFVIELIHMDRWYCVLWDSGCFRIKDKFFTKSGAIISAERNIKGILKKEASDAEYKRERDDVERSYVLMDK